MILHRYFAKRFLTTFLMIFAVLAGIMVFVDLVEQLRLFSGQDARFSDIIRLTLLNIPKGLYSILPLIVILTTLTLFLSLARSSELVVTRAAGRSALRALLAPILMAAIIGVTAVAVMNPIVAATSRAYEAQGIALTGDNSALTLGNSGLWLRQGSADQQAVIRAKRSNLDGTELSGVTFMVFEGDQGLTQRIEAERAQLTPGAWTLQGATLWPLGAGQNPQQQVQRFERYNLPSTLTATQIRDSFGAPDAIQIWDLPAFVDRLQTAGFSAQRYEMWFQMELAQPLFFVAMVMIGAAFTLRHQRGGRTGLMVLFAILLSFGVYFLRNFAQVLGENGQLPILLAAWAPPLAAIGLSLGLLLHQEDG